MPSIRHTYLEEPHERKSPNGHGQDDRRTVPIRIQIEGPSERDNLSSQSAFVLFELDPPKQKAT